MPRHAVILPIEITVTMINVRTIVCREFTRIYANVLFALIRVDSRFSPF